MTKVEAIIRPNKLEDVKAALDDLGLFGITVSHVMGSGKQRGRTQHYRGQEYVVSLLDKIKVETVVTDDMVDSVMNAIADAAGTGEIGDGKIFVYNVDNAMRIRTREAGESAVR
ncbi:MAG: P-II family nitrogen regulator [Armatimonadota bacterium]